jgi:hypothetical protein
MTTERTLQGGLDSYYVMEDIDLYVCDTTGRYGEDESYTRATSKYISVYIFPGGGGNLCGYRQQFIVSVGFNGVGYKKFGDGNFYGVEIITAFGINYYTNLSVCYDGSDAVVENTADNALVDDSCNGPGAWDECSSAEPEITVVGAP